MCKIKINTFCATTYLEKQICFLLSLITTKTVFQNFSSCQGDASCHSVLYYQVAVGEFILFRVFLFADGCFLTEGNSRLLVFPALLTPRFDKHTCDGAGYWSLCLNCTHSWKKAERMFILLYFKQELWHLKLMLKISELLVQLLPMRVDNYNTGNKSISGPCQYENIIY